MPLSPAPSTRIPVLRAIRAADWRAPAMARELCYRPGRLAGQKGAWFYEVGTDSGKYLFEVGGGQGALRFLQDQRQSREPASGGGAWPPRFLPPTLLRHATSEVFSGTPFFPGDPQTTPPLLLAGWLDLEADAWLVEQAQALAQQVQRAVLAQREASLSRWVPYLADITGNEPALRWLALLASAKPEGIEGLGWSLLSTSAWLWQPEGVSGWSAKLFLRLLRTITLSTAYPDIPGLARLDEHQREVLRLSAADFCFALAAGESDSKPAAR